MTPRNRAFRRSSWTSRPSPPLPVSSPRASASASLSRLPRMRASPSRLCRSSSPRSSTSAAGRSSASSRTMPTPATRPRLRAGSWARRPSASLRRAASVGEAGSSRRRTWSASGRARSQSWKPVGSSAPRRSGPRRASRRERRDLRLSACARATSPGARSSSSGWRSRATSVSSRRRSAGSSRSAAASSTSIRPPVASPSVSSSSATRSSRCVPTPPSHSGRCIRWTRR